MEDFDETYIEIGPTYDHTPGEVVLQVYEKSNDPDTPQFNADRFLDMADNHWRNTSIDSYQKEMNEEELGEFAHKSHRRLERLMSREQAAELVNAASKGERDDPIADNFSDVLENEPEPDSLLEDLEVERQYDASVDTEGYGLSTRDEDYIELDIDVSDRY